MKNQPHPNPRPTYKFRVMIDMSNEPPIERVNQVLAGMGIKERVRAGFEGFNLFMQTSVELDDDALDEAQEHLQNSVSEVLASHGLEVLSVDFVGKVIKDGPEGQ